MIPYKITTKDTSNKNSVDTKEILNSAVVSKGGITIGKVSSITINSNNNKIFGISVHRGIFRKPLYIGLEYIKSIKEGSTLLNIDPVIWLKGRKVVTFEGKVLGRVRDIKRKKDSNGLDSLKVKKFFIISYKIPKSYINQIGDSIILKKGYNVKKIFF